MEQEYVPYEECLKLKELGFNEYCMGACYYEYTSNKGVSTYLLRLPDDCDSKDGVKAPIYQQVFRWFREKYQLSGIPTHQSYDVWELTKNECFMEVYPIDSFEEAQVQCLRKLIEIVKGGEQ